MDPEEFEERLQILGDSIEAPNAINKQGQSLQNAIDRLTRGLNDTFRSSDNVEKYIDGWDSNYHLCEDIITDVRKMKAAEHCYGTFLFQRLVFEYGYCSADSVDLQQLENRLNSLMATLTSIKSKTEDLRSERRRYDEQRR